MKKKTKEEIYIWFSNMYFSSNYFYNKLPWFYYLDMFSLRKKRKKEGIYFINNYGNYEVFNIKKNEKDNYFLS